MGPRLAFSLILVLLALLTQPSGATARRATCGGKKATIQGTRRADVLKGTKRADVIVGGLGDDVLRGLKGNDILCGGDGNDDLVGGPGNDATLGGLGSDGVFGGEGDDSLAGEDGDYDLVVGGPGNDRLDGGPGVVDLLLNNFAPGPVTADLSTGAATGDGNDVLLGFEVLNGSDFGDTLVSGPTFSRLSGGLGNDVLRGSEGSNTFEGGQGDDQITGNGGSDSLTYVNAQAGIQADLAVGTATGEGSDSISGITTLDGSAFNDTLLGDDGRNYIFGDDGDDRLEGRGGDDDLYGGLGRDTVDGGEGEDTCEQESSNCERPPPIFEYFFFTSITTPRQGQTLPAAALTRLEGEASGGLGGSPEKIRVGIRQLTANGCRWWDGKLRRMLPQPCESPRWQDASFPENERGWSYALGGTLPAGWYEVRLQIVTTNYRGETFEAEEGSWEFRLT